MNHFNYKHLLLIVVVSALLLVVGFLKFYSSTQQTAVQSQSSKVSLTKPDAEAPVYEPEGLFGFFNWINGGNEDSENSLSPLPKHTAPGSIPLGAVGSAQTSQSKFMPRGPDDLTAPKPPRLLD